MKLALPRPKRGMSLAEIALTAAVLAAVILLVFQSLATRSELRRRELTIKRILAVQDALEKFAVDNAGRFPPESLGLRVLLEPPPLTSGYRLLRWRGPYLPGAEYLFDGWGRPFWYRLDGPGDPPRPYQLWSYGRDNSDGGQGADADIDVWNRDSLVP
jgi:general secretion pathway protein G